MLVLPVFFVVLLLGAVVVGPLLYFALAVVWPIPFHRAMDRALLICALAALGLFWSRISLSQLWPWDGRAWKQVLLGLLIAAVSMQAMIGLHLATGGFTSAGLSAGKVGGRVLLAFVAAIVAAPLEETIFRGFLQRELAQGGGWRIGWLVAAAIYTVAHFLKVPVELDHQPVHLWSGATALLAAFSHFGHDIVQWSNLGKVVNLFIVGLILGGTFLRAGSLWLNAGLHGGWIFGLLLFTGLTRPFPRFASVPPSQWEARFGTDILSSPGTTLVLILTGIWLWRFYRHPSIQPETSPGTGPSAP
jgi:membrane protease YdiL (CAAX protease family)